MTNNPEKIIISGQGETTYGSLGDKVKAQADEHRRQVLQKAAEKVEKAAIKVSKSNFLNEWWRKWRLAKAKKRYESALNAMKQIVY